METWDDSESSEYNSEKEEVNMALEANTKAFESESDSKSNSDFGEVFSHLTCSELELFLAEILENV